MNRKMISAAVATAIAAPMTFGLAAPAQADEIAGAIQSVSVQGAAAPGSVLTVDAAWRVPDGSKPGDTFTLALPAELAPLQTSFPLYSADGAVIANASVANGVVVVTLSDEVANRPHNIAGGLKFNVSVTQEATPGEEIVLNWGGVVSAPVVVAGGDGTGPKAEDNNASVKWPGNTPDGRNTWGIKITGGKSNVVLTDTPQDHQISCDYVHVRLADFDGTQYVNYREADGALQCSPNLMTYNIAEIPAGSALFFSYEVQEAGKDSDGDGQLVNRWDVTSTEMTEGSVATGQSFGAGGWGSGDKPVSQIPGDFPTVDLPEADIPVITEVPGDYPVHEKPEADVPNITEVPNTAPVHEKPEIAIEQEVPGDFPTVDKPEGEIGIVPDTAPVHEKPEVHIWAKPNTPPTAEKPELKIEEAPRPAEDPKTENPAPSVEKPTAEVEVEPSNPAPKADKPEGKVEGGPSTPAPKAEKPVVTVELKKGDKVEVVECFSADENTIVVENTDGDRVTIPTDEVKQVVDAEGNQVTQFPVGAGDLGATGIKQGAGVNGWLIAAIISALAAVGVVLARQARR